jgi:hypothetical protein
MKRIIVIPLLILLTFVSCNNSKKQENKEQKQETPQALQKKNSIELISNGRGYGDLIENLYSELADKTPELKELETKIELLSSSKSDSCKEFQEYNQKSKSFYHSANYHITEISDSILRTKMKELIASSLTKYNSKIFQHTELLKSIDQKTTTLNDLHEILKITASLSLIEKYQSENLSTKNPMNEYLKQLDKVISTENYLLEKNNKK